MNDQHAHAAHQNTPDVNLLTTEQMQSRILELETEIATRDLFQRVMEASATYVTRFKGEMQFHGAARKMQEDVGVRRKSCCRHAYQNIHQRTRGIDCLHPGVRRGFNHVIRVFAPFDGQQA